MTNRYVFVFLLYSICLLCACHNSQNSSQESIPQFVPQYKENFEIELPLFVPCPMGWTETDFDAGGGYVVTYCEPPDLDSTQNPMNPLAPNFLPCPDGWNEVENEQTGITTCNPYPDESPMICERLDEMHPLGEPGCIQIGTECPEGPWASNLPSDGNIIYVQADAPLGGDGSMSNPFTAIGEAIEHAGSDAIIALSKGIFIESIELPRGILLWGACVAETILVGNSSSGSRSVITVHNSNTGARNLQITGPMAGVDIVGRFASFQLEDAVIKETQAFGISISMGQSSLKNVVVRDTESQPSDGNLGNGLIAGYGAEVDIKKSIFKNNTEGGMRIFGEGTKVRIEDVAIRNTQSRPSDGKLGTGLEINMGAEVELKRAFLQKNTTIGIGVFEQGTKLQLEDVIVRDTKSRPFDRLLGCGLQAVMGAKVEIKRSVFQNNRMSSVLVYHTDTAVRLEDVVVWDTQSAENDGTMGNGLLIGKRSKVQVMRSAIQNNKSDAVLIGDEGTEALFEDVVVSDTKGQYRDKTGGRGFWAQDGADVTVIKSIFKNNRSAGLFITGEGTKAIFEGVVVSDTQSQYSDKTGGFGLLAQKGAIVTVKRSSLQNNRAFGVIIFGEGTHVLLEDVVVRDTKSEESNEYYGRGLSVTEGSEVRVKRSVFQNNREHGINIRDQGTKVFLEDVVVRDTQSVEGNGHFGRGLGVVLGAEVEVKRTILENNREISVAVGFEGSRLKMSDVIVSNTMMRQCASDDREYWQSPCEIFTGGVGIVSAGGASIDVQRFVITGNSMCGVQSSMIDNGEASTRGGIISLSQGIISNNAVCGINIQTNDTDITQSINNVLFIGNNHNNIDQIILPLISTDY